MSKSFNLKKIANTPAVQAQFDALFSDPLIRQQFELQQRSKKDAFIRSRDLVKKVQFLKRLQLAAKAKQHSLHEQASKPEIPVQEPSHGKNPTDFLKNNPQFAGFFNPQITNKQQKRQDWLPQQLQQSGGSSGGKRISQQQRIQGGKNVATTQLSGSGQSLDVDQDERQINKSLLKTFNNKQSIQKMKLIVKKNLIQTIASVYDVFKSLNKEQISIQSIQRHGIMPRSQIQDLSSGIVQSVKELVQTGQVVQKDDVTRHLKQKAENYVIQKKQKQDDAAAKAQQQVSAVKSGPMKGQFVQLPQNITAQSVGSDLQQQPMQQKSLTGTKGITDYVFGSNAAKQLANYITSDSVWKRYSRSIIRKVSGANALSANSQWKQLAMRQDDMRVNLQGPIWFAFAKCLGQVRRSTGSGYGHSRDSRIELVQFINDGVQIAAQRNIQKINPITANNPNIPKLWGKLDQQVNATKHKVQVKKDQFAPVQDGPQQVKYHEKRSDSYGSKSMEDPQYRDLRAQVHNSINNIINNILNNGIKKGSIESDFIDALIQKSRDTIANSWVRANAKKSGTQSINAIQSGVNGQGGSQVVGQKPVQMANTKTQGHQTFLSGIKQQVSNFSKMIQQFTKASGYQIMRKQSTGAQISKKQFAKFDIMYAYNYLVKLQSTELIPDDKKRFFTDSKQVKVDEQKMNAHALNLKVPVQQISTYLPKIKKVQNMYGNFDQRMRLNSGANKRQTQASAMPSLVNEGWVVLYTSAMQKIKQLRQSGMNEQQIVKSFEGSKIRPDFINSLINDQRYWKISGNNPQSISSFSNIDYKMPYQQAATQQIQNPFSGKVEQADDIISQFGSQSWQELAMNALSYIVHYDEKYRSLAQAFKASGKKDKQIQAKMQKADLHRMQARSLTRNLGYMLVPGKTAGPKTSLQSILTRINQILKQPATSLQQKKNIKRLIHGDNYAQQIFELSKMSNQQRTKWKQRAQKIVGQGRGKDHIQMNAPQYDKNSVINKRPSQSTQYVQAILHAVKSAFGDRPIPPKFQSMIKSLSNGQIYSYIHQPNLPIPRQLKELSKFWQTVKTAKTNLLNGMFIKLSKLDNMQKIASTILGKNDNIYHASKKSVMKQFLEKSNNILNRFAQINTDKYQVQYAYDGDGSFRPYSDAKVFANINQAQKNMHDKAKQYLSKMKKIEDPLEPQNIQRFFAEKIPVVKLYNEQTPLNYEVSIKKSFVQRNQMAHQVCKIKVVSVK